MLLLFLHPGFELADRFALGRQFDVGVNGVNFGCGRVAHQSHPHFLEDASLHEAGVEGVAEIVKADVADTGVSQRSLPSSFYDADGLAVKLDHEALGVLAFTKEFIQAFRKWNLP